MVHHDFETLPLGQLDQFLRLLGSGGKGLLDEDVFPVLKRGLGQLKVRANGSHYGNGVDMCGRQQLDWVRSDGLVRISLLEPLECG